MWWIFLLLIIVIPIIFFFNSSNTKKKFNKDIEKNPYDHRNNIPPPGGPF